MRTKHRLIGGGVRCDDGCSADFAASALRADAARCDARPGSPAPGSAGGNGRTPYVRFPVPSRSCVRLSVRLSENVGFHPYVFLLRRGPGEFGAGRLGGNVRRRREAGYVPLSCSGSRRSGAVRAAPAAEIRPQRGRAALVEPRFFTLMEIVVFTASAASHVRCGPFAAVPMRRTGLRRKGAGASRRRRRTAEEPENRRAEKPLAPCLAPPPERREERAREAAATESGGRGRFAARRKRAVRVAAARRTADRPQSRLRPHSRALRA